MKNLLVKTSLVSVLILSIFSCKKSETVGENANESKMNYDESAAVSDSVSSVASLQVKDKQFIKSADVEMDVKDVYETTISLEKSLKNLGGFVTSSRLNSQIVSEKTFNTSDEKATLVRKFQTENRMQVRVPTEKLGEFLTIINDQKLFLNSRNILAEDVTANIKLAELEAKRAAKTGSNIDKLALNKDKVNLSNDNQSESNYQKVATFEMTDNLKYSTVDISIRDPKVRTAEIAVTNTDNIDNKYKFNFFYEMKNGFVEGFYLIQKLIVGLVSIWPLLLICAAIFYFYKTRKKTKTVAFKSEN